MARDYAKTIGHLIAMAEDESLPEAARATYREKAEAMMREYRIEEEQAIATESTAAVPVLDVITIMESRAYSNPLRQHYWGMWSRIATHCGVRSVGQYTNWSSDDTSQLQAKVVGYEGDIRYAELLFTAARLVFMTRIDARVDRGLSDQENCYFMRNSGMKRNEIARMLWGSAPTDGPAHGRVQKLYLAECTKRGEAPRVSGRGIQVEIYREAYAKGFVNELSWRLQNASAAVDKASGGLVLHGRKERVDEAFYTEFPTQRPKTAEQAAADLARWEAEEADCEGCKRTSSKTGKCKDHRPRFMTEAEYRRHRRMTDSPEARAGSRAGERAAAEVHIGRSGTPAARKAEAAPQQTAISG